MAAIREEITRALSEDSSAMSNITVAGAGAQLDDDASDRVSASTPPTSLAESGSLGSGKKPIAETSLKDQDGSTLRPRRTRSCVTSYNINKLAKAQIANSQGSASRNVSGLTGRTLVGEDDEDATPYGNKSGKALAMEWESSRASPARKKLRTLQRKPSVKDKVKKVVGNVRSVLGKRGRDVMEVGKRTLGMGEREEATKQSKILKQLDTGKKGVLDELDLDEDFSVPVRPTKKAKLDRAALKEKTLTPVLQATLPLPTEATSGKKWQKQGLYVGQPSDAPTNQNGSRKKLHKKRPQSSASDATIDVSMEEADIPPKPSFMPLPMFKYLEKTRPFVIPYDVFAPSFKKGDEKPKDWHQINKNRLIGEAKELWEDEKLAASACSCLPPTTDGDEGCGEHCWNRIMMYECNDKNCNLSASQCSNRQFADLTKRVKKGGAFDVGVEVVKTDKRGFGVRACRAFAPGEIIMEYTGEVISEAECQRRMRELYQNKQCYYLMELERGLIIDGTRGSMARFINHSCEPNCDVRMVKVNDVPRMGVFAGESGIVTGQELSYDYNFDNFGSTHQICYCGAPSCRGFLSKRLNAVEQKKMLKVELERQRKEAEEAQRKAVEEQRRKKIKTDRGSSWRGWLAVDDPETKERLKREKREREEAEKSSSRAMRLARRRESMPPTQVKPTAEKPDTKRRRTTTVEFETIRRVSTETSADEEVLAGAQVVKRTGRKSRVVSTASSISASTRGKETVVSVATREGLVDSEDNIFLFVPDKDGEGSTGVEKNRPGSKAASKSKEAIKSVGRVVKSFTGSSVKSSTSSGGSNKLRQTMLSFSKIE
ncbi:Hypothetical protein R9X50_00448400 [Acrodontium crateriforme]|uniref:Uncharacterized protein n=1 Tax=Acrodontium crateriforme TaxID=150365 RepID=A0AAQ3R8F3_9PEZI|nr:Hypothetical protein R9X50_00448400 [Acrodontium crateriforme]